jgi:hypothetical protein
LRETGLPFSNDGLELVRDEVVTIALTDGKEQHVLVFSEFTPPHFIAGHLFPVAMIKASIVIMAE